MSKRRKRTVRGGHGRSLKQFLKEAPRNSAIIAAIVSVLVGIYFHEGTLSLTNPTGFLSFFQELVVVFIVVFPIVFIIWFVKIEMGL